MTQRVYLFDGYAGMSEDDLKQRCRLLADEIERLREALETCASWIDRWTSHVGNCEGGDKCTCGRTAVLFDAGAIEQIACKHGEPPGACPSCLDLKGDMHREND